MPAYADLPWLNVSPRDFLQAAEAGARAALEATSLATKSRVADDRTPKLANSGLPFIHSPPPLRSESPLDQANAALAFARAQQIQNEIANPTPPPPVHRFQVAGEGGPPGIYDLSTGAFTQNPLYTPKPEKTVGPKVSSVPVLIPGTPNPITGESSDRVVTMAPEIAKSFLESGPDTVKTNQFNVGVLRGLQTLQPPEVPQGANASLEGKQVRDKQTGEIGTIINGEFVSDQKPAIEPPSVFFGNPENAPEEQLNPNVNFQ